MQKQYFRLFFILLLLLFVLRGFAQQSNYLRYVNPFIGTTKSAVLTRWGSAGGTYPGAVAPSGAMQLSPETRVTGTKGYDYADTSIYYFSCFKHFSGFPEGSSGRFYIMPVSSGQPFEAGKSSRKFSHVKEASQPGYYKVVFEDDGATAEATTTARTGMFRFTFPAKKTPRVFVGDAGEISTPAKQVIQASNGNTIINFSEPFLEKKQVTGGWVFSFSASSTPKTITLKLSASTVNFKSAQLNIDREIGSQNFDQVKEKTRNLWAGKLAVVAITDPDEQNKTIFYTALYHSLLMPWVVDDAGGNYMGLDGKIHQKSGKNEYGGFSPWDTFRSLHPLLSLLCPEKQNDVILSMLDVYKQSGHLPVETMTGNHAIPIIVDSYVKGITNFDKNLAYKAMKKSLVEPPFIQPDMEVYQQNGYIPFMKPESVTRTMEYAYDDWAMAQFAKSAAKDENGYQQLINRSYNYRNLFDADELFFLPKNQQEFKLNPGNVGYKEGDKWVYSYFVPQNGQDLINLMGGQKEFAARLDSALTHNVILFDNETVFHLPYFFNQAGKPDLTQKWCRQIMLERFGNNPGGLPGNDDLGSTSSWYVFSALGLYPVCPGRPLYAIGSPLFQSATLHLPNGKKLVINTKNSSLKEAFVQSLTVNGKDWQQLTLPHSTLQNGGTIGFNLGSKPGNWAKGQVAEVLSETRDNADFQTVQFSTGKRSIEPNEPFTIRFSIKNNGSTGTKIVSISANNHIFAGKNSMVAAGELKKDSIVCRLYAIGKTELKMEGAPPVLVEVKLPKTPVNHPFTITNLTAKPLVKWNETQQVFYSVQNVEGLKRTFKVPVNINGAVVFTDSVTLEPGEKRKVEHTFTATQNGFQRIGVGEEELRYKVYQSRLEALLLDLPLLASGANTSLKDNSGFGNDAVFITLNSAKKQQTPSGFLFGENAFAEVKNAPSLDILGENLTMMAQVYPTGNEKGLVDILSKGDNHVLQVTDGKTLTFFAGGWGRGDCTVSLPPDWKNHWHYIAGVCEGKKLFVYIDGKLCGTAATEETVNLSNTNKWTLGRNEEFPGERFFHGNIKNVKIFREALSAEEIGALSKP